jgi:hypothetical protein
MNPTKHAHRLTQGAERANLDLAGRNIGKACRVATSDHEDLAALPFGAFVFLSSLAAHYDSQRRTTGNP